jgi:hypothetical protein
MNELRNDATLTTAEIAHPEPAREAQVAVMEERDAATDPITAIRQGAVEPATSPLFPDDELHNFRAQWDKAQTSFVDEPRKAVEQADSLVANVVKRIAEQFSTERAQLEKQWDQGDNVSTEELRQALKRYRSFFDRLLTF